MPPSFSWCTTGYAAAPCSHAVAAFGLALPRLLALRVVYQASVCDDEDALPVRVFSMLVSTFVLLYLFIVRESCLPACLHACLHGPRRRVSVVLARFAPP